MGRFRLIRVALLPALVLGVVVTSGAQAATAPFFTIGGTRLVAGKTHNFDARAVSTFTLSAPSLGLTIECSSFRTIMAAMLGSNAGLPGKEVEIGLFTNCSMTGLGAGCKVTEPIETNPLTSQLVEIAGTKEPLGEEFKPTSGKVVGVLKFEGAECILNEAAIEGEVATQTLTDNSKEEAVELGQKAGEAPSWLAKFPAATITGVLSVNTKGEKQSHKLQELTIIGEPLSLEGTELILLANTKLEPDRSGKWSPLP